MSGTIRVLFVGGSADGRVEDVDDRRRYLEVASIPMDLRAAMRPWDPARRWDVVYKIERYVLRTLSGIHFAVPIGPGSLTDAELLQKLVQSYPNQAQRRFLEENKDWIDQYAS